MNISAYITNQRGEHTVTLTTDGSSKLLAIPPKPEGFGSSANGGELLFLALATCYCNDLYREAKKRRIATHCEAREDQRLSCQQSHRDWLDF